MQPDTPKKRRTRAKSTSLDPVIETVEAPSAILRTNAMKFGADFAKTIAEDNREITKCQIEADLARDQAVMAAHVKLAENSSEEFKWRTMDRIEQLGADRNRNCAQAADSGREFAYAWGLKAMCFIAAIACPLLVAYATNNRDNSRASS